MQKRHVHVFVDESGNTNIATEKEGVSDFFTITAIVVDHPELELVQRRAEVIRKKYFQTGEIKSQSVGKNDKRRILVLQAINELSFQSLSFVVEKGELNKECGLAYKKSFFKRLNRYLYQRIYKAVELVDLMADEHGDAEFIEGFIRYINRTIPPNLFSSRTFQFVPSDQEVLIGVADFISGSLSRCFQPEFVTEYTEEILGLVRGKSVGIETWPTRVMPVQMQAVSTSEPGQLDAQIRNHCIRSVEVFIGENPLTEKSEEEDRARIFVLKLLLFNEKFGDEIEFMTTSSILKYLEESAGIKMSEHKFRSAIISNLRDTGVIIASGASGYKIPVCESDVRSFVSHANTIILPMMDRLARARTDLLMYSGGKLDILGYPDFNQLRAMAEAAVIRRTKI